MNNLLTFVVPVRHPENATDWRALQATLAQTVRSISGQDVDAWQAVIVANRGAELVQLPPRFSVAWVDFAANPVFRQAETDADLFYEAVRRDKGRRVLAGMLHACGAGHFMVVDDDDFVSRRLAGFVAANPLANGWYFGEGYVWSDGGWLLYRHSDFSQLCGTSHIVRSDLFSLPSSFEEADEAYVRRMLGSHIFLDDHLRETGAPLAPLPFVGAVYRTGHAQAHSRSRGVLRQYFLRRSLLANPPEMARRLSRVRLRTPPVDREFFGGAPAFGRPRGENRQVHDVERGGDAS